jgi:hypothetical protein
VALGKKLKVGGSYFKGYQLTVNATPGDYALNISTAQDRVINSVQVIPDAYGIGDYFSIKHHTDTAAGAVVLHTIATTVFNCGAGVGISFDFPALHPVKPKEDLRIIYTNVASTATVVNVLVECIQ